MKKTILITGASGNLGKAAVEKFQAMDYNVTATVSPGKTLEYPVNGAVDAYDTDLSNENSSAETVRKIIKKYKAIDAALLLAGGFAPGSIASTNAEALRKMFATNFDTAYNIAKPVFQQMISQPEGGRIVFIGARPALNAGDGKHAIAYALSKSLVVKLSEFLNAEGSSRKVISSVIIPSIIDTPVNRASMPNANFSTWVTSQEIVDAMSFIVGDNGKSLREPVLKIYGGS